MDKKLLDLLWIDDDASESFGGFRRWLERLDMNVDVATTTEAAMRLFEKGSYESVIIDMSLGKPEDIPAHLEFIKRLNQQGAPVMILSAFMEDPEIERWEKEGFKVVKKENLTPQSLADVENWIKRKKESEDT